VYKSIIITIKGGSMEWYLTLGLTWRPPFVWFLMTRPGSRGQKLSTYR